MDWIRDNKPLAAILGVTLLGSLALGYLLFASWSEYTEASETYQAVGQQIGALKGERLSPTDANLKSKQAVVAEYSAQVNKLGAALLFLQTPAEPIKEIDFQAKLKTKISETRTQAAEKKMQLPADFAFGFEEYTGKLPVSAAAATELSGYLDALHELVQLLMKSGVQSVDLFQRSKLPIESQATAPQPANNNNNNFGRQVQGPAPISEKRQIVLNLTLDQGPLQLLVSRLTNPEDMKYFTSLRLLRIENEKQDGPLRKDVKIAPQDQNVLSGTPVQDTTKKEEVASDDIKPPAPAYEDTRQVFGSEPLKVRMEIDLVKFLDAAKGVAAQAPAGR
ncbi:Amuc_1100 family pilus-like protein [Prosthecobacter sp.]|uniref:Amuc_1100 family pilus-like protein n=1 Tax=Prosthecobacter sp. TaxID=1965333 RepID=UPI0037850C7F